MTLERWAAAVAADAVFEWMPEEEAFWAEAAEESGVMGAWGMGPTKEDARQELESVLEGWAELKIRFGDRDIPVVNGIDLNQSG